MSKLVHLIRIGAYTVRVCETQSIPDAVGEWHRDRLTIKLFRGLRGSERREVLLHEILHAVSDLAGLGLSERTVSTLSLLLHQALGESLTDMDVIEAPPPQPMGDADTITIPETSNAELMGE